MSSKLLPLHQNNTTLPKISGAQPGVADDTAFQTQFFYVGKNIKKIDFLISSFDSGYATENPDSAISILTRLAGKSEIPAIIIIDSIFRDQELWKLHRFMAKQTHYSRVPFVLDASGLTPAEIKRFRSFPFLDELIFMEGLDTQKFMIKVNFLNKIKDRSRHLQESKRSTPRSINTLEQKNLSKRIFDVVVASLALIVLSPLFIVIAIAIRVESRGPIFYIAKRAGRGYRIFDFYKFRTMVFDADKRVDELSELNLYKSTTNTAPLFFKYSNDPRVTRMGTFLRNTSLDELPQFINVLIGDMSLVGNRPLPLYEASKLTTDQLAARFMAPVGITGLWQIKKRGQDVMSMEERINLDIDYADHNNFLYDLWIMANTPSALMQKTNV
ncbi:MAG: sugar transferase [Chitinophagaceae bacterium]